jgi:hypothetical protein
MIPALIVLLVCIFAGYVWMTPAPAPDMFPGATAEQIRSATAIPLEEQ